MLTSLRRVFKAGFVGFWRNAYVSLASIFVITISLLVIGATIFIDQTLTVSLERLQSKVDINVYFVTTAEENDILKLKTELEALADVESVTYTSREEELEKYREEHRNDEVAMQALEELDDNPLRATLAIQAKKTSHYESIAQFLDEKKQLETTQTQLISNINYIKNKEAIDNLTTIIQATEQASFITMMVLVVASVLITLNTVRLAIYTSREEISVMRLVGASNMFIRGPFMLQGIMYGLISGVLALLILYPILAYLGPNTETFLEFNLFSYYVSNFAYIFSILVGTGVVLGLVSSTFAVARYLRV
ncbi:ABC transporter permease [Candidatus Kaiserbacteria bacterium]|nr:ABC transporter permease [Candidatus Kaiserbacteria bacterium]